MLSGEAFTYMPSESGARTGDAIETVCRVGFICARGAARRKCKLFIKYGRYIAVTFLSLIVNFYFVPYTTTFLPEYSTMSAVSRKYVDRKLCVRSLHILFASLSNNVNNCIIITFD